MVHNKEDDFKKLRKEWKEIEDKLGLNALERLKNYYLQLWMKIEDLITSREKWKERCLIAERK